MNHRASEAERDRRLDEIEEMLLQGVGTGEIVRHFQGPESEGGPPRWRGRGGEPLHERQIADYIAQARRRIRERKVPQREEALQFALARGQRIYRKAYQAGELREASAAMRFVAELDGTQLAAEEAQRPTLWQEVQGLMGRVMDFDPEHPFAGCPDIPGDIDAALRQDAALVDQIRGLLRPSLVSL